MKKLFFLICFTSITVFANANIWVVDSLNDSGTGSLRAAADSIVAGDTIRFNPNLIASGSDSIVLTTGEIDFSNKGVVIFGLYTASDTLFISGGDSSRIFSFNQAGRVVLDSLVLINGNGEGAIDSGVGGAIFRKSCLDTLFVFNSKISGNTCAYSGGAIYANSPSSSPAPSAIWIENSVLSDNSAYRGGAIYNASNYRAYNTNVPNSYSFIALIKSKVIGNSANDGGGIWSLASSENYVNSVTHIYVDESEISGNTAVNNGGAIYSKSSFQSSIYGTSSEITLKNSIVSGNTAESGGAVYSYAWSYSFANAYSLNYHATSSVSLLNTTLTGNSATSGNGGGIYSEAEGAYASYCNSLVTITKSKVSSNSATGLGGGVYSYSDYSYIGDSAAISSVIVTNSTIGNNTATSGGGIYSESAFSKAKSLVQINKSTLFDNIASAGDGGGIYSTANYSYNSNYASNSIVDIANSTITGNSSTNNGGGIFSAISSLTSAPFFSKVSVSNSTITKNTAAINGSGIYSFATIPNNSSIPVFGSIIAENDSASSGIYSSASQTITSSGFNIFSDSLVGKISSDSFNIDSTQINLQTLGFNGGDSWTMLPGQGSIALNSGDPNDFSDAQNAPIVGVRNIGAAEDCYAFPTHISIIECYSYTTPSGAITYYTSGVYTDTIVTSCGADSLITIDLTINNTQSSHVIFSCDSYTSPSGNYVWTTSNVYTDTLPNSLGCDSIITIDLTINNSATATTYSTITETACDSYLSPSGYYTWTSSNTYMDTIPNAVNCDSIITINLTINNSSAASITETACSNYSSPSGKYVWTSSGTYMDTIPNASNCDSIISIDLTIYGTKSIHSVNACNNYTWINGVTYYSSNSSDSVLFTNVHGCDSIIYLDLNLNTTQYATDVITACGSYTWNGITYTSNNNVAKDTLTTIWGCDSIVTLDLVIVQPSFGTHVVSACDSLTWNGIVYTSSNNTALDTLVNAAGCDSIVTLNLTITNSVHIVDTVSACYYYLWSDGNFYVADNDSAVQMFTAGNGCDSILHLDLDIHIGTFATDTQVVCDSLVWIDGNTYYTNNTTAIHTLTGGNSNGCDSVVTLNLTVNGSASTDVISSCGAYTWIDGNTYTSNNNSSTHTFTNSLGCDSIVTLDLTINGTTYGTETVSICDSYTWNGITYTSSNNSATDTLVNSNGCDSIITLDLTILNSDQQTDVITACDTYTWIDGITYTSSNNTATQLFTNVNGCDSIVTLDLTINPTTYSTDSIVAVNQYTWIDGVTYSASNTSASHTIPNSNGCDSIITLSLHIEFVQIGVQQNGPRLTANATFGTFQWVECPDYDIIPGATDSVFTPSQNGSYAVIVTQNGFTDTSDCITVNNVSIQAPELIGISLYPNPTSDVLNIDKGSNSALEITITNSAGATVHYSTTQNQITTINMAQMATGMYVVTLKNELGQKVERVVKR
ncbi:MAG: beta strand repeat-containing protein [Salibacteraceae bacterium]